MEDKLNFVTSLHCVLHTRKTSAKYGPGLLWGSQVSYIPVLRLLLLLQSTVDKLIKKANLAMIIGTSSWREQFVDAIAVNGGKKVVTVPATK